MLEFLEDRICIEGDGGSGVIWLEVYTELFSTLSPSPSPCESVEPGMLSPESDFAGEKSLIPRIVSPSIM